jgi:hypothetical protein
MPSLGDYCYHFQKLSSCKSFALVLNPREARAIFSGLTIALRFISTTEHRMKRQVCKSVEALSSCIPVHEQSASHKKSSFSSKAPFAWGDWIALSPAHTQTTHRHQPVTYAPLSAMIGRYVAENSETPCVTALDGHAAAWIIHTFSSPPGAAPAAEPDVQSSSAPASGSSRGSSDTTVDLDASLLASFSNSSLTNIVAFMRPEFMPIAPQIQADMDAMRLNLY